MHGLRSEKLPIEDAKLIAANGIAGTEDVEDIMEKIVEYEKQRRHDWRMSQKVKKDDRRRARRLARVRV